MKIKPCDSRMKVAVLLLIPTLIPRSSLLQVSAQADVAKLILKQKTANNRIMPVFSILRVYAHDIMF